MARKPIGETAMTATERQRRHRQAVAVSREAAEAARRKTWKKRGVIDAGMIEQTCEMFLEVLKALYDNPPPGLSKILDAPKNEIEDGCRYYVLEMLDAIQRTCGILIEKYGGFER